MKTANLPFRGASASGGFTLIELMITVIIIGILACIAYPSYTEYVRRTHRTEAKAILMETAQFMERYRTTNNSYVDAKVTSVSDVVPKGAAGNNIRYTISFTADPTANAYTVQAIRSNAQANDKCGTLTVNQSGAQTAALAGCW